MQMVCVLLMLFGIAAFSLGFSILYKLQDLPRWIVTVQELLVVSQSNPKAALGGLLICLMGLGPFVVGLITFSTFRR